jgi:hypothetical protein
MCNPINTINGVSDYYGEPIAFYLPSISKPDEAFTEIESFALEVQAGSFVCGDNRVPNASPNQPFYMVTAGPWAGPSAVLGGWNAGPGVYPANVTSQGLRSIGLVQQDLSGLHNDYPAASFFDIYVHVFLPPVTGTLTANAFPVQAGTVPTSMGLQAAELANAAANPLIITNNGITSFPPQVTYIHGQTPAVPINFVGDNSPWWTNGEVFGYLILAGHGVFSCTNSDDATNCCGTVESMLDQALGPVGAPNPPMPVPWSRADNSFPTAGTYLHSVENVLLPTGAETNDLSDSVSFSLNGTAVTMSHVYLGPFSNSVAPPAAYQTTNYTGSNIGVSFNLAIEGLLGSFSGTASSVSMVISNTGLPSATLHYATPPGMTNYTVVMASMAATRCVCPNLGLFMFLQADPSSTNASLGEETIEAATSGYAVSVYDDVHWQLSTDGDNWDGVDANRAMRLVTSLPANTKTVSPVLVIGSVVTNTAGISTVQLKWDVAATLQVASTLAGTNQWTSLTSSNTYGPYTITIGTNQQQFFRLKFP